MNLDRDRHTEAQRRTLDAEAAIARYYRDFLLGRALPPADYLAALFDSLGRDTAKTIRSDAGEGSAAAEAVRH